MLAFIASVLGARVPHSLTGSGQALERVARELGTQRFPYNVHEINWAVLIAGSKDYINYRHQADLMHAYHVLHEIGGIPEENIIVMMYDDIAWADENPFPGTVVNTPGGLDIYAGVPHDWVGRDVNARNFLNVLRGVIDPKHPAKVLQSTVRDNVFVYYADHGARGLVGMPHGPPLFADQLMDAIESMRKRNMFNNLLFYMESCESGSMFEDLKEDMGVFALTATNSIEPSFACLWDSERLAFLSDQFSYGWILDSESNMTKNFETVFQQYETVKGRTTKSEVNSFGDASVGVWHVDQFQGDRRQKVRDTQTEFVEPTDLVSQRDVGLAVLKKRIELASDPAVVYKLKQDMTDLLSYRNQTEYMMRGLVEYLVKSHGPSMPRSLTYWQTTQDFWPPRNWQALRELWDFAGDKCLEFDEWSLQFWGLLVALNERFGNVALRLAMTLKCD